MSKILKGDIVRVTGGVEAIGKIWWVQPGKQSVLAAEIEAGETVVLGPYVTDAQFKIVMEYGSYIAQTVGSRSELVPVPLADFIEGGSGDDGVAWGDVTGKPATFPPAAHTHAIADVTDLQAALDARPTGTGITAIVSITEAAYDALDPKDPATLYVING